MQGNEILKTIKASLEKDLHIDPVKHPSAVLLACVLHADRFFAQYTIIEKLRKGRPNQSNDSYRKSIP